MNPILHNIPNAQERVSQFRGEASTKTSWQPFSTPKLRHHLGHFMRWLTVRQPSAPKQQLNHKSI